MTPRPLATIALVTFVVLVLEITSTRLFAYVGGAHATATALSIALLGLGAGAATRLRYPDAATPQRAALALPAGLLVVTAAATAGASLELLVAVAVAPFALAGILVADAYAARGSAAARTTYALDLFAAACGCLIAPRLVGPLSPVEIISVLGLLACGLALLGAARGASIGVAMLAFAHAGVLVAGQLGALADGPLHALLRADISEKAIVETPTTAADILDSAWSPLGRLDVHRARGDRERLGLYTDGMSPTYLVEASHAKARSFEETWGLLMSLPYRALAPSRVLVLGAGAGASVWLAKHHGATTVDAVEVNPAIADVLARWRQFGGDVYGQPGVRLYIDDARRHLTQTTARYDLIELALALTGNAHAQPAGMEAHLYTVEATELYLRRLTPSGTLVLIHSDPGNAYRQLLTVMAALERLGIARERALEGLVVLHDPRPDTAYRYLIVVGTAPIPLEQVDRFDVAPAELLWGPGDPPERGQQLFDRAQLGATADDDLDPVYDERPYFFQNTKGVLATAQAQHGRLGVLAGALLLVGVLISGRGAQRPGRAALVATALGTAFLVVELALIQRFTLAAGGTLHALSFVLFSLLAWGGAGALLLGAWWHRHPRGVTWSCLVAALAIGITAIVIEVDWADAISSDAARLLALAAMLAPAGLAIGCPFPTLLAHHARSPDHVARLWAINGAAAVAGGVIAVLALRVFGSTDTLVLAAALYAAAAVVAPPSTGSS